MTPAEQEEKDTVQYIWRQLYNDTLQTLIATSGIATDKAPEIIPEFAAQKQRMENLSTMARDFAKAGVEHWLAFKGSQEK